jgi:hypothetical protein
VAVRTEAEETTQMAVNSAIDTEYKKEDDFIKEVTSCEDFN